MKNWVCFNAFKWYSNENPIGTLTFEEYSQKPNNIICEKLSMWKHLFI